MPRTIECELTEDMVDQCVPGVWSSDVPAAHVAHRRTTSTSPTTYNIHLSYNVHHTAARTPRASPAHAWRVRADASGSEAASARVRVPHVQLCA